MTFKLAAHAFIRWLSLICFVRLPYGRIERIGKPDLRGRVILAPTHNNFYCDIAIAGNETPALPRWMAKVGLFRPPFARLLRFLGAFPVVRILDGAGAVENPRETNQATFDQAVAELRLEGAFCIFPEGNSLHRPGINLPLKNGIAKLALAAESAADFSLGLRIIPMGIDYGDRTAFGGGVVVRYGEAVLPSRFAAIYREDPRQAVKSLMAELTKNLLAVSPHFETFAESEAAFLLERLAIETDRLEISTVIGRARAANDPDLARFLEKARGFRANFSAGSEEVIGSARLWRGFSWPRRVRLYLFLFAFLLPVGWSVLHNFLAKQALRVLVRRVSEAPPDFMTVHIGLAILCVPSVYFLQFLGLYLLWADGGFFRFVSGYLIYTVIGIGTWFAEQHWRRAHGFAWSNFLARTGLARAALVAAATPVFELEKSFILLSARYRGSRPGRSASV